MSKSKAEIRKEVRAKANKGKAAARAGRGKARGVCAVVGMLVALLAFAGMGCATATPSSASNSQDISHCNVTVNLNVPAAPVPSIDTNLLVQAGFDPLLVAKFATLFATGPAPVFDITITDVFGTQAVNNEGMTTQTATPTNQNGLTGDEPIKQTAGVAKAGLTGGATEVIDGAKEVVKGATTGSQ